MILSRQKLWRFLRYFLLFFVVVMLMLFLVSEVIIRHCVAPTPSLGKNPSILKEKLRYVGKKRVYFGHSWLEKRQGIWFQYLEGGPFEIGYASGRLTERLMRLQEDEFLSFVDQKLKNAFFRRLVRTVVAYFTCSLGDYIIPEYRRLLLGVSVAVPNKRPYLGESYNVYLNYHAAHDLSHLVLDTKLLEAAGCTGFAAWGKATKGGDIIAGRNFDFEAVKAFDRYKVVTFVKPKRGIPFLSVGWASFFGVVSGMNRAGISISLYGAHSEDKRSVGTPVALVARQVMQYAKTLDEAQKILCQAKIFVSESFLVGSRKEGRFVVIEKTPKRCFRREPRGESIIVANHFLTRKLRSDPANEDYKRRGTSLLRFRRMKELVRRYWGKIDHLKAASILRDRRGLHDRDVGNGNRTTLNALIATHSVIFNLSKMQLWVSHYPHQLGKFVAFDVRDPEKRWPELTIPSDPFLRQGYSRYLKSLQLLKKAQQLVERKHYKKALLLARRLDKMNPHFFKVLTLLGRIYIELGDLQKAGRVLRQALSVQPAYLSDRLRITRLRQRLNRLKIR